MKMFNFNLKSIILGLFLKNYYILLQLCLLFINKECHTFPWISINDKFSVDIFS